MSTIATATPAGARPVAQAEHPGIAQQSAVAWPAIFAGAVIATAATILLFLLGSGIGLSSVSPWQNTGATATTFAVGAAIWLIVVQWISSLLGGYIAGRLRTRGTGIHTDEAFFRDTAHGLAAWAVATLLTVMVVASAGTGLLSGGARALGGAAGATVQGASQGSASLVAGMDPSALLDTLFRPAQVGANGNTGDAKTEAGRILATSLANGSMTPADRTYLAQLAAATTSWRRPRRQRTRPSRRRRRPGRLVRSWRSTRSSRCWSAPSSRARQARSGGAYATRDPLV